MVTRVVLAGRIAHALESARNAHEFDQLVVMAAPRFPGMLREAMPKHLRELIVAEVVKDLMHESEDAVRAHLPITVASAKAHPPA